MKWIKVEDEKPGIGEDVIVYVEGMIPDRFIATRYADRWESDCLGYSFGFQPSHWMERPERPERGEK